jgi:nucleotide-binding universal stress UspA family protein
VFQNGDMERILLAVDGSEHSSRAAELAGELSAKLEAKVDVIHVLPEDEFHSPALHTYADDYAQLEQYRETRLAALKSRGSNLVVAAARQVEDGGGEVGEEEVAVGDPAEEIVTMARRTHADCIIMGRRGLGKLRGLALGSVSNKVGNLTDKTLITTE